MSIIRRRLFWKLYLTLLASLAAAAILMGAFWWFLSRAQHEWWDASRIRVTNTGDPRQDLTSHLINKTHRLGGEAGADVSVYAPDGTLISARGEPIRLLARDAGSRWGPGHILRVDLPDGNIMLTRLRPPATERGFIILALVLSVAGCLGLAAFPVTARLTRKLEALRLGVERWGQGELSARVDETGSDEVALVARTFNTAASKLDMVMTSQKALLANASHELRSPLARLRFAAELWLQKPSESIRAEIIQNLAEVDQLVDEILLSSRLDHSEAGLGHLERIDLLGLAAEEATRVDASVEGEPVEIDGDPILLRRLLRNLLENARKHGAPPIEVTVSADKQEARIAVADHGPGIAREERERVFEPFYRPRGRTEADGGWGLGLALVRQIALRHGGTVSCSGEAGNNSCFVVRLPLIARQPQQPVSD